VVSGYVSFADNAGAAATVVLPSPAQLFDYLSRQQFGAAGDPSTNVGATTDLTVPSVPVLSFVCNFLTGTGNAPSLALNGIEYYETGPANAAGAGPVALDPGSTKAFVFFPIDVDAGAPRIGMAPIGGGGGGTPTWEQVLAAGDTTGTEYPNFNNGFLMDPLADVADPALPIIPWVEGAPGSAPADGALVVDTQADVLYFRSSGAWFTGSTIAPAFPSIDSCAATVVTQVVTAGATATVGATLWSTVYDSGPFVNVATGWLDLPNNQKWHVEWIWDGSEVLNHSNTSFLQGLLQKSDNGAVTQIARNIFRFENPDTEFCHVLSADIQTGAVGPQGIYAELVNSANRDIQINAGRVSAHRLI
jgi:hypothetical protein